MKYLHLYNSKDDAIGTTALTPFVGTVVGAKKVVYGTKVVYGDTVDVVSDDPIDYFKIKSNTPILTITTEDTTDIVLLHLTATRNDSVVGDIVWSTNIDTSIIKIEGNNLTFLKHYEGQITLMAESVNC